MLPMLPSPSKPPLLLPLQPPLEPPLLPPDEPPPSSLVKPGGLLELHAQTAPAIDVSPENKRARAKADMNDDLPTG